MHDRFSVSTLDAAASVGGQAIEHARAEATARWSLCLGERTQTAISMSFFLNCSSFVLDTLAKKLEELLRVLVLA